jgi:predicted HTH domain antitoxin
LALGGAEVIYTKDDKPVVRLMPVREDDVPLPESASFDQAVELFLANACSLSRAAELAGVTRWDIIGHLKERGIKIPIKMHRTAAEIDALAEELDRQGAL